MKIVAVTMVKNEDLYITQVLDAISDFVDEYIVVDTGSTDGTVDLVRSFGVEPFIESDLLRTHDYVQGYFGLKNVWLFGVDGDELFDKAALRRMRRGMEAGWYDDAYQVQGWYLHATRINEERRRAKGFLGPPAHTPTKLYNMKNIPCWPPDEKNTLFHPKTRVAHGLKARAYPDESWEDSPLRCIHTRFLTRSTTEQKEQDGARLHPQDLVGRGSKRDRGGKNEKNERLAYRKGKEVEVVIWPLS
jgi:hypothetical protein